MKHNKWMKTAACILALMMAAVCLALPGFAEGNSSLVPYECTFRSPNTTLVLDGNENVIKPAYAETELKFRLGNSESVIGVYLDSSDFSLDRDRSTLEVKEQSSSDTSGTYYKNDTNGGSNELVVHFANLYYWGVSKTLKLKILVHSGDNTVEKTADFTYNQFNKITDVPPAPTPTPDNPDTPAKDAAAPYLSGYSLTTPAGGEIIELKENQRCNVVLRITDPALAAQDISASRICTKLNTSAFTFTGLGEISKYDEESGSFIALFRDAIYNGKSNEIKVDLWYKDSDLPLRTVTGQFGVLNADPAADIKHTSNLIVRDVNYGSQVTAGEPFNLSLTLFSSIGDESISDVIVRLVLPEGISVVNGSESGFIANMAPRSTATVSFNLQTKTNIDKNVATIGVDISGTGSVSYNSVSSSTNISLPISQPIRFEITNLECPSDLIAGTEDVLSATYVNKGKNSISNVTATLTGTNLVNGDQSQYLGNVESGSEKSVEFNLTAQEEGNVSGMFTLTYEDDNGVEQSISRPFSCTVEAAPTYEDWGGDLPMVEEPAPAGPPLWLYILLGILVIAGGFAGFKVWKRHQSKKAAAKAEAEDENETEDSFEYRPVPPANEGSAHEVH